MSYYTEKTLSSIRSIIDEWSIRKEGGKQSFFVLKEIDKLLADTPVDDVVSSKDVADKKNEVTMLRLERDEQLIRQQLDHAKKETQDVTKYKTTINELNALLADEKMTLAAYRNNPLSDQVADRDNRIEQLMVLNEALRVDIDDHIAVQDRIIDGLEETLKLERIDHTAEMSAVKKTLHETIKGLRSRMAGARIIIDNQATSIEGLRKDLDARNTVIKDFKAIEQKETDRLHKTIEGNGKTIDELNDMHCDVCGKLEKIEKIAEHPAYDCFSTALDEITKIIQEE